jgi:hypothetical protein
MACRGLYYEGMSKIDYAREFEKSAFAWFREKHCESKKCSVFRTYTGPYVDQEECKKCFERGE